MEIFLTVVIAIVMLVSTWVIFSKSGVSGWKSLIPIYSNLVLLKIVELPFWYIFLYLIPIVNLYAIFKTFIRLAHKFGRTAAFGVGLVLLPLVFMPILAMGDKEGTTNKETIKVNTKDLIIAIAIVLGIAIALTWIFPITYFGYSYVEEARSQVGLFELFSVAPVLFQFFGNTIFYILIIGGFYGVLHKVDGYRNLLDKVVSKFKGKEWLFLSATIIIFAFITSMAGITTGLLFMFPFVISIILLMGYNKLTAALTTIGSIAIGLIGTTVSPANTNVIMSILQTDIKSELITKIIILVIGIVLLVFNVLRYAKKHKEEKEIFELPISDNKKIKSWPIVLIVDLILLVMILSSISWDSAFGIKFFTEIHEKFMTFAIGGFPIIGKIFGVENTPAFGSWTLTQFTMMLTLGAIVIGLIYKVNFVEIVKNFVDGIKKALKPALIVFLAYLVLVITATHPVLLAVCKPLLTLTSGFNPFTMSIVAFLNSIFNIEPYYIASATGSLQYAISIISDTTTYPIIAVVWQTMQGLATLIAPTSVILIVTLSYLDVSFIQWIKASWKLLLEILVVLLIIFTILILI